MKLLTCLKPRSLSRSAGFTLVEMMISTVIYITLLVGTSVALMIFGLRVCTLAGTKLSATSGAMKVLDQVRDDVRGAKTDSVGSLTVGNDPSTFATDKTNQPGANVSMTGSALQIFTTTNTLPYTVYYLDTTGGTNYFKKSTTSDGVNFSTSVLAGYITNLVVFTLEDPDETPQTNFSNNRILKMELDFYQWEYPIGIVGGQGFNAYDFYRLTTRISRRMID